MEGQADQHIERPAERWHLIHIHGAEYGRLRRPSSSQGVLRDAECEPAKHKQCCRDASIVTVETVQCPWQQVPQSETTHATRHKPVDQYVDFEVFWRDDKLYGFCPTAALELYLILFCQKVLLGDGLGILFLFDLDNCADCLHDHHKNGDACTIQTAVEQQVVIDLSAGVGKLQHQGEDASQKPWQCPQQYLDIQQIIVYCN